MSKRPAVCMGLLAVLTGAVLAGTTSVFAQEETKQKSERNQGVTVDSFFRSMPKQSVKAGGGKITLFETDTDCSYTFYVKDKLPVKVWLSPNHIGIDDDSVPLSLPSHLVELQTGIETTLPAFKLANTYMRFGIQPSFLGDDWSFPSSSFRIPSYAVGIYKPTERLTLIAGAGFYPEFETEVVPIVGFIYKASDALTLKIIPKRPTITYRLNDRWALFAEGGGSLGNEYEVTRGDSKHIVLQYKELHAGTGARFTLNDNLQASVSAGGVFDRSLRYRDNQGKVCIDNGLYTEFRLRIML